VKGRIVSIVKIRIPDPVKVVDRKTDKVVASVDFDDVLDILMSDPKWVSNYLMIRRANSIYEARKNSTDGVITLEVEDWKPLKECAEKPKRSVFLPNGQMNVLEGFGYHPIVAAQVFPLIEAIVHPDRDD
jgi:hypothetical protein